MALLPLLRAMRSTIVPPWLRGWQNPHEVAARRAGPAGRACLLSWTATGGLGQRAEAQTAGSLQFWTASASRPASELQAAGRGRAPGHASSRGQPAERVSHPDSRPIYRTSGGGRAVMPRESNAMHVLTHADDRDEGRACWASTAGAPMKRAPSEIGGASRAWRRDRSLAALRSALLSPHRVQLLDYDTFYAGGL